MNENALEGRGISAMLQALEDDMTRLEASHADLSDALQDLRESMRERKKLSVNLLLRQAYQDRTLREAEKPSICAICSRLSLRKVATSAEAEAGGYDLIAYCEHYHEPIKSVIVECEARKLAAEFKA